MPLESTVVAAIAHDEHDSSLLSSPDQDVANYIASLSRLSLPELLAEPSNLSSQIAVTETSLITLCHNEYQTFHSLRQTSSSIVHSFDTLEADLGALLESIPTLESASQEFVATARDIQHERQETSMLLGHQDKLLDILDIPQLVDTCVRSGYHQEALELAAHTEKIANHFHDIDLIRDVQTEVQSAIHTMVVQLFNSLKLRAKLPTLFRSISLLRRIGNLQEDELALAFLINRLEFIQGQLQGIIRDEQDSVRRLRRYVDVWRESVNDLVNQMDAIFKDVKAPVDVQTTIFTLLSAALQRLLSDLLTVLERDLSSVVEPTSLTSLLTQLTYCSISFSHIGLDFRSLLNPLFENAILQILCSAIDEASNKLTSSLKDAQSLQKKPSTFLLSVGAVVDDAVMDEKSSSESTIGASLKHVASLKPLAKYLNSLIGVLNHVRLLGPVNALEILVTAFDQSLAEVSKALLLYGKAYLGLHKDSSEMPDSAERRVLTYAGRILSKELIPFVRTALIETIYGSQLQLHSTGEILRSHEEAWSQYFGSENENDIGASVTTNTENTAAV